MGEAREDRSTRLLIGAWVMRVTADGIVYYEDENARGKAGLQVRQHQAPIRPFKELLDGYLEGMRKHVDRIQVRPVEEIVTHEGEHGALTVLTGIGKADGQRVTTLLAVVCADDWYDRFDGWVSEPSETERFVRIARDAVAGHVLRLGERRSRRYYYKTPPGWQALQRDQLVQWFPLGFPNHHSVIAVPPAFPGNVMPHPNVEAIIGRRFVSFKKSRDPIIENVTFNGLGGVIRHDAGSYANEGMRATHMVTAALVDVTKSMTYLLRLETTDEHLDRDRKVLQAMCESIRPVPLMTGGVVDTALEMIWPE